MQKGWMDGRRDGWKAAKGKMEHGHLEPFRSWRWQLGRGREGGAIAEFGWRRDSNILRPPIDGDGREEVGGQGGLAIRHF